jgi:DNA-binding CsgD family transcriptional regulator
MSESSVLTTFGGFLDEARDSLSLQQLGRALVGLTSSLGYERCVIVDVAEIVANGRRAVLFTSDPKDKARTQVYPGHEITKFAAQNDEPITLEELRRRLGIDPVTWKNSLPQEAQTGTSLLLPVHRKGRLVLKIACNGRHADASPLARSMLHAAAHVTYDSIIALNERSPIPLTGREAECLRWACLGKSAAEIGRIASIGTRTVRVHLKNAKKKLGVNTPLEALVNLAGSGSPHRRVQQ